MGDIPDGIYGFSKIPAAGILQIFLLTGLIELAWWPASNYSGDYGIGFWGKKWQGEDKLQKQRRDGQRPPRDAGRGGQHARRGPDGHDLQGAAPRAQLQPVHLD